ncbi:MAG: hypothetical protein SGBAC_002249 [Bacillariaceae sp.]
MITSNLIQMHPHIGMLQDTIFSLHRFLENIPFNTPIYVVVDGLPPKEVSDNNKERRKQYIQNIREHNFAPFTNVQAVPMEEHKFLAGCVKFTLENYIETEFLYIIQHDLPFCRKVDHRRLLKTMHEHPDVLFNVRFRQAFGKKVDKQRSNEQSTLCRNLIYGDMDGTDKQRD